ncbi:Mitochondrial ribosomal protein L18 [Chamberlinius hualienensis]
MATTMLAANSQSLSSLSQVFIKRLCNSTFLNVKNTPGMYIRASSQSSQISDEPWSENDIVNPKVENRNPRNLEKMYLAIKPKGFSLDSPSGHFYNKLFLDKSSKHLKAYVQHNSGQIILTASTSEWGIRKLLYSGSDVTAAKNLGKIIARRCLESGIINVHVSFTQDERKSEAVSNFLSAVQSEGLALAEPNRIYPLRPWD